MERALLFIVVGELVWVITLLWLIESKLKDLIKRG